MKNTPASLIPAEHLARAILVIRGEKVILDVELAALYGVPTRALNQAVRRNATSFPADFMFQLTPEEKTQVITICDHLPTLKFSPTLPYAFTEHGALMAANVLNSDRAVEMSLHLVRTFVKLRQAILQHEEIAHKLHELERRVGQHDVHLAGIVRKLREMSETPQPKKVRVIGFVRPEDED